MASSSCRGAVGLARVGGLGYGIGMRGSRDPIYAGHRYPGEVISHAVWLYFRYPLSLRMVEEMLAARGIVVSHETIRQWGLKFGHEIASRLRRRAPGAPAARPQSRPAPDVQG